MVSSSSSSSSSSSLSLSSSFSGWAVVIPLYVSWRVFWAARLPITDCDEVYNYWEPLHFLLYGTGQQTWEYAHEYALRTYAYLVPLKFLARSILLPLIKTYPTVLRKMIVPMLVSSSLSASRDAGNSINLVSDDKLALFILFRAILGMITAICELLWLRSLAKRLQQQYKQAERNPTKSKNSSASVEDYSTVVVLFTGVLLLTATGMNHAAAAYLPSATWMAAWCLAASCFLESHHFAFVVVSVMATLTTGWPFGAVSVVPMALHILVKEWNYGVQSWLRFVSSIVTVTVIIQGIVFLIDYEYYGVWISPTLRIVTYNAGNSGDELYGVEPMSYYVKNLLLNLNAMAPLGMIALPVYVLFGQHFDGSILSMLLCLPAWLAVTVPRPHKEERFLFPIYPILVYGAVLTLDTLCNRFIVLIVDNKSSRAPSKQRLIRLALHFFAWIPVVCISLSRTTALWKYYTAPLEVYNHLSEHIIHESTATYNEKSPLLVCTCGEWYRFPGSFYLPYPYEIGFLPSSFKGQLPQPFTAHGSRRESQKVLQPFNDENREQTERYVKNISDCQFIVDLSDGKCGSEENVEKEMIFSFPFLDGERTPSALHRVLFIPFFHENAVLSGKVVYQFFVLYKVHHLSQAGSE